MGALRGLESLELLLAGFWLACLPLRIGHAIDLLARGVPRQAKPRRVTGLHQPIGQAVAAEAGMDHQINILHISPLGQMCHKLAKSRRFQRLLRCFIHGHLHFPFKRPLKAQGLVFQYSFQDRRQNVDPACNACRIANQILAYLQQAMGQSFDSAMAVHRIAR